MNTFAESTITDICPAPWTVDAGRLVDATGLEISGGAPELPAEVNARLLALQGAAPDLLEALKRVTFAHAGHLARLREEQRSYRSATKQAALQPRIDQMQATIQRAGAAIAKAEGRAE